MNKSLEQENQQDSKTKILKSDIVVEEKIIRIKKYFLIFCLSNFNGYFFVCTAIFLVLFAYF